MSEEEGPEVPLYTEVSLSGGGAAVEVKANESLEDAMAIAVAAWEQIRPRGKEPVGFGAEARPDTETRGHPRLGHGSFETQIDVE